MLLTTKQVAQKLGVHPRVVRGLITRNLLRPANAPKENAHKTVWEFDSKVVRDFAATYVPVVRGPRKPKSNGHAHDVQTLPLDIPTMVALAARLERIEARLIRVQEVVLDTDAKLGNLLAVWK